MVKDVSSVVFMAATQEEFDAAANVLSYGDDVPSNDTEVKGVIVGFRQNTVGLATHQRSMRACGCAKALLTMAASSKLFFKVGGSTTLRRRFKIGTIAVLS